MNLDDVWQLCYAEKGKAVRALKANFIENVDFIVIAQNGKNPDGGRPTDDYYLTSACLEYFVSRKVRPVFEVYRRVFHRAIAQVQQTSLQEQVQANLTFADCFIMTFLVSEVCYTLRCNEKLKIELIETKEKLKEAEDELESANRQVTRNSKVASFYSLLRKLWKERWECEHAKVLYCKRRITSKQLVDAMNHAEKEESEISNKISELTKDLNELDKK